MADDCVIRGKIPNKIQHLYLCENVVQGKPDKKDIRRINREVYISDLLNRKNALLKRINSADKFSEVSHLPKPALRNSSDEKVENFDYWEKLSDCKKHHISKVDRLYKTVIEAFIDNCYELENIADVIDIKIYLDWEYFNSSISFPLAEVVAKTQDGKLWVTKSKRAYMGVSSRVGAVVSDALNDNLAIQSLMYSSDTRLIDDVHGFHCQPLSVFNCTIEIDGYIDIFRKLGFEMVKTSINGRFDEYHFKQH